MRKPLPLLLLLPCALLAQVPDYVPTDGLVAWYPLDGNGEDAGPLELNGIVNNATPLNNRLGAANQALSFDGDGDWINLGNLDDWDFVDYSINLWYSTTENPDLADYRALICRGDAYGVHIGDTGGGGGANSMAYVNANGFSGAFNYVDLSDGHWHMMTAVRSSENGYLKLYVDGGLADSVEAGSGSLSSPQPLSIGRYWDINPHWFNGGIDDCGIWGRALQADEIEGLYLSTPGCTDPSACNYQSYATHDNGGCDYCSCVGKFHLGASFSNPIVSHGTQEIYTPWGAADLSEIEDVSVTKLVGGEGFFVALKEDSTIAVISPELNTNPIQFDQPVIDIAAGRGDISAVLLDGSVADFGNNSSDYFITDITNATHCARSWNFGMALKEDGSLDGWGNFYPSPDSLTDIIAIDAGVWHAVALTSDGRIHEWGYDGQSGEVLTSSEAIASLTGIVDISAGTSATMAIFEDGSAKAWTWPEGMVYLDIPASEGVVDGAVNWSISTYITYDGRSVTSSNFGNADVQLDVEPQIACGVCVYDFDGNDICNEGAVLGCIDSTACNYELAHTIDDGSCIPSGCLDASACNFNPLAQCAGEACDFSCCPGPGCCSSVEYWDAVLQQCIYPAPDTLIIMVTDTVFIESETSPISCGAGTVWDPVNEECIVAIPADINFDGCVTVADLLELLAVHGTCPPYPEWPDNTADNTWTCGDPLNYWDYDYATVLIGDQCWFAENLRNTRYQNGDNITLWDYPGEVNTYGIGHYTFKDLNPANTDTFGLLYTWHAATHELHLCPAGWRTPSKQDYQTLMDATDLLTGNPSPTHKVTALQSPSIWTLGSGTNATGFAALPGSQRTPWGNLGYGSQYEEAFWWTTNEDNGNVTNLSLAEPLNGGDKIIGFGTCDNPNDGMSVRCIKN